MRTAKSLSYQCLWHIGAFNSTCSVEPRASDLNDGRKARWTASAAHLDASKMRRCRSRLAVGSLPVAVAIACVAGAFLDMLMMCH